MFSALNPRCPSLLAAANWLLPPSSAPQPWPCLQSTQTALFFGKGGHSNHGCLHEGDFLPSFTFLQLVFSQTCSLALTVIRGCSRLGQPGFGFLIGFQRFISNVGLSSAVPVWGVQGHRHRMTQKRGVFLKLCF